MLKLKILALCSFALIGSLALSDAQAQNAAKIRTVILKSQFFNGLGFGFANPIGIDPKKVISMQTTIKIENGQIISVSPASDLGCATYIDLPILPAGPSAPSSDIGLTCPSGNLSAIPHNQVSAVITVQLAN